jgi:hypothetical protein
MYPSGEKGSGTHNIKKARYVRSAVIRSTATATSTAVAYTRRDLFRASRAWIRKRRKRRRRRRRGKFDVGIDLEASPQRERAQEVLERLVEVGHLLRLPLELRLVQFHHPPLPDATTATSATTISD